MEIRVLKYFLLVAREENITKAAELMHLTQPTLSRQLMQLEKELGVQLFRRSKHRIILTEEGMLLRRRAEEIVALAEKTKEDLQHREEQLTGTVAVGSGELQSSRFLSQLLTAFQEKNPLVRFAIYSGNSDNIKERIERGLLDVGLLQEPVDITRYSLSVQALCRALGASCVWDEDARTAVCTYRDTTISLTVGAGTALVDGQEVALQAPPALRDGVLAAGCQVFSDAWGLDCFCPFSPDGTSRDGWIVIP